jgi:hypothetical protein
VVEEVRVVALPQAPFQVSIRVAAPAGTELADARLAASKTKPCTEGIGPVALAEHDKLQAHGPLHVGGMHELELTFPLAAVKKVQSGSALDLWLVSDKGVGCARIPIADVESKGAGWQLHPASAGVWLDVGMYTLATSGGLPGDDPRWLIFERIGAVFGEHRAWAEIQGGTDHVGSRGLLVLGLGADRRLWGNGRLGFRIGAGYGLALTTRLDEEPPVREHVLHGPRAQPSLTFALLSPTGQLGLPAGERTLHLHLDAPIAIWFGSGDAPPVVLAAGAAIGVSMGF